MNPSGNVFSIAKALESLSACTVWHPDFQEAWRLITKCIETTRNRKDPSSALLIGPTGVGKTRLSLMIEKQLGTIRVVQTGECRKTIRPCVYVELPESATIKSLSLFMAKTLGGQPNDHQSVTSLEFFIIERLITMEVQLVILDDFHHVAEKGLKKTKSSVCKWLMKLLNNSGIPFLITGASEAETTINMLQELSDRFPYRGRLKIPPFNEEKSESSLLGIISCLQQEMVSLGQLKSYPYLTDQYHFKALYLATRGNLRKLSNLLHDAFHTALLRGDYTLKIDDFAQAADDLAFCCSPNYFRMTHSQLNNALKASAKKASKTAI